MSPAKLQGQQDSLLDLLETDRDLFLMTIRSIPEGTEFSVNDVRSTLDHFEIPEKSRAGLFAAAMSQGLMEPVVVHHTGMLIPVTVDSTGASAHRAKVKVYRRL